MITRKHFRNDFLISLFRPEKNYTGSINSPFHVGYAVLYSTRHFEYLLFILSSNISDLVYLLIAAIFL